MDSLSFPNEFFPGLLCSSNVVVLWFHLVIKLGKGIKKINGKDVVLILLRALFRYFRFGQTLLPSRHIMFVGEQLTFY